MPSRQLLSPPQNHHFFPLIISTSILTLILILIIISFLCFRRIKRKRTAPVFSETDSKKPPFRFSYSVIRNATGNFSSSVKLGQGGFGSVYKAQLKDKDLVFVNCFKSQLDFNAKDSVFSTNSNTQLDFKTKDSVFKHKDSIFTTFCKAQFNVNAKDSVFSTDSQTQLDFNAKDSVFKHEDSVFTTNLDSQLDFNGKDSVFKHKDSIFTTKTQLDFNAKDLDFKSKYSIFTSFLKSQLGFKIKDLIFKQKDSSFNNSFSRTQLAVKVMEAGSLQGEREFQNELLFSSKIECENICSVIGFACDERKNRKVLVYELMGNGSLQDCLFSKKSKELRDWSKRFLIGLDVAKGLEYLHHCCDPVIIHGDIKPSNILLDSGFNAKIGDFGLARFKVEENCNVDVEVKDNGSVLEETESVRSVVMGSGFEEGRSACHLGGVETSPESVIVRIEASPEAVVGIELSPEGGTGHVVSPRTLDAVASPSDGFDKTSFSDGNFDGCSVRSFGEKSGWKTKKKKSITGKDWWWKQDTNGEGGSGNVKDYVMEWIGSEIKKERPKSDWIGDSSSLASKMEKKKKKRRQLDWWISLEDDKKGKKEKRRPAREWWKEEFCEELEKKKKKNKKKKQLKGSMSDDCFSENWWPRDDEMYSDRKNKRSRNQSRGSRGNMDKWLDFSGELWRARKNSYDSVSGEIPRSGGISSTPSMRGTVCYIAPEYGGGGDVSEKCDVYSYGVLLLVLVAGRRPLQVTGSPMSEFQRANLLSWAKRLARAGKLLDLVDTNIESLDQEQALLCIKVALLCLQRSPACRPSMREVVGMLSGDLISPPLPVEFSPSPPSRVPYKSRKKVR